MTYMQIIVERASKNISKAICDCLGDGVAFERPYDGTIILEKVYIHERADRGGYFVTVPVEGIEISQAMAQTVAELEEQREKLQRQLDEINQNLRNNEANYNQRANHEESQTV